MTVILSTSMSKDPTSDDPIRYLSRSVLRAGNLLDLTFDNFDVVVLVQIGGLAEHIPQSSDRLDEVLLVLHA